MKKHFLGALTASFLVVLLIFYFIRNSHNAPSLGGDFTLIHEGQPFHFAEKAKTLNILYIGYAKCPDVCPMALSNTAQALKGLPSEDRHEVQVLFISVDAQNDTAEAVATYARQFNSEFIGLTGTKEQIDAAIQPFGASYMIEENKKSYLGYSIAHTDRLYFLDKRGRVKDLITSPRSSDEILKKIKELL